MRLPKSKILVDKFFENIASKIYKNNKNENIITLPDNYGRDAIAEVYIKNIPPILDGKSLAETELKSRYKLNFLMYKRKGKIRDVTKDTIFPKEDVVVFGPYREIKKLFNC